MLGAAAFSFKSSLFVCSQMVLSSVWGFLFFSLQTPVLGVIDMMLIWVLIGASLLKFYTFSKSSVVLLLPYLVWVSLASTITL